MRSSLLCRVFTTLLALSILSGFGPVLRPALAATGENWKQEFDDICSRTDDAMSLQPAELKQLISRCDELRPSIEKLDETQKKIYTKKLQMCRDLFLFVLSAK